MTYPIKTRTHQLYAPLFCFNCKEEIKLGEKYTGGKGREVHIDCLSTDQK